MIYEQQSSFRKNHSTKLFSNDTNLKGFDNGLLTEMILIDFQKAFNAFNHDILNIIGFN